MVKQDLELARRAVACKGWRWIPGMLAKTVWAQARVLGGEGDRPVLSAIHHHGNGFMLHHPNNLPCDSFPQANTAYPFLPDLTDPATVGCLLALVRKAWGDDTITTKWIYDKAFTHWTFCSIVPGLGGCNGPTEAAALVAALEAAP